MDFNSLTILRIMSTKCLGASLLPFCSQAECLHLTLELACTRHAKAGISLKIAIIETAILSTEPLVNRCQEDLLRK